MKEWIVEEENVGDLMRGEAIVRGELIRCKDCRWKYKKQL